MPDNLPIISGSVCYGCRQRDIWLLEKNIKMAEAKKILRTLEQDYDHPWPNEDLMTAAHRKVMLEQIRKCLNG